MMDRIRRSTPSTANAPSMDEGPKRTYLPLRYLSTDTTAGCRIYGVIFDCVRDTAGCNQRFGEGGTGHAADYRQRDNDGIGPIEINGAEAVVRRDLDGVCVRI